MRDGGIICAIGDVHGEAERLRALHDILLEQRSLRWPGHDLTIVHLGDYVDRGPDSCGVIAHIQAMEAKAACQIISLAGNHEQMMLDGLSDKQPGALDLWLDNGGRQTLDSYEQRGHPQVPDAHLDWLRALPSLHIEETAKLIFVHAGIDPDTYPGCGRAVRLWTRTSRFFRADEWTNPALEGWRVVHGHTPTRDSFPEVEGHEGHKGQRINIDTGAVYGGQLTAAVFAPGEALQFLYA